MNRETLRSNIAYVEQNSPLVAGTILENLKMGNSNVTYDECCDALEKVGLEHLIQRGASGIESPIGEGSFNLSGGERQRLAMARAILSDAKILLLDELTSNLDSLSEKKMKEAIKGMRGERTIIMVAHRLSTILDSDKIFVLEHGRLVGSGTHVELLESVPLYKELAKEQFLAYEYRIMTNKIEIRDVTKTFKEGDILKNVSFTAEEGEVTAFLGPNGAGKSSTLRILLGLDRPSSGTALIGGKKYCDIERPLLTVGASFDGVGAPSDRTVFQHLKIAAASNGIDYSRISEVLSITDIEHKRNSKIGNLSLGEGQRLGIATALLGNPQYLILDEPTNGLDPSGIRWFRNFIREQANTGKTVLLSSHILSEVEAVTDRVVFIDKGSIIALGTLHNILNGFDNLEDVFFHLTGGDYDE